MTHDDIRLEIPLAASGSFPASHEVMQHITECAPCRSEYEELRALYQSVQNVPNAQTIDEDWSGHDAMRQQFQARLTEDSTTEANPVVTSVPRRRAPQNPWMSRMGWAAALVIVAAGAGLGWHQHQLAQTRIRISSFVADAAVHVALRGPNPTHQADLYVKGRRVLIVPHSLPTLTSHRVYEGWWITNGKPIPAGIFTNNPVFLNLPDTHPSAFAITVEPSGGTKTPTTPVLVSGAIPG